MFSIVHPLDVNISGQGVTVNLLLATKWITGPLDNENGTVEPAQVLYTGAVRLTRGMKGVSEANDSMNTGSLSDHGRHSSTHRFSTNYQAAGIELSNDHVP